MRFALVGGDTRQVWLAKLLRADGHQVRCAGLERGVTDCVPLKTALEDAEFVILPLPTGGGETVNAPLSEAPVSVDALCSLLTPEQLVLVGKAEGRLPERLREYGVRYADYFTREELTVRNAAITAEGAVEILMRELPVTLLGADVLVIGFGRIGKLLALRLHLLGAHVTVSARRPEDRAWIECLGLRALDTNRLDGHLGEYAAVVNTVPAMVLDGERLEQLRRDCLCLDLASRPGGVDLDAAQTLGLRAIQALALPGKAAPATSARAIRDTVYHIIDDITYNYMNDQ